MLYNFHLIFDWIQTSQSSRENVIRVHNFFCTQILPNVLCGPYTCLIMSLTVLTYRKGVLESLTDIQGGPKKKFMM